jgi:wyosine [tRNA(Phe)-imidazoG37] synthetase (radical SAM superfamily)
VRQEVWRQVNRPHGKIELTAILDGALAFARAFEGELATETMLVKGINDQQEELEKIADFIKRLDTTASYIAVPTRPPAEKYVEKAEPKKINLAYQIFKDRNIKTEYLIGYEGNEFSSTGDLKKDLLNITAVHPLKEEAVQELIKKTGSSWESAAELIAENKIIVSEYNGEKYYLRK